MTRSIALVTLVSAITFGLVSCGDDDVEATGNGEPAVSLVSPGNGETVESPVTIEMEAEGITIEPAGDVREGAGHFHVMVDVDCVEPGETIPGDTDGYHHFGDGSTEAELELDAGQHTLCLQVGDGAHTALDITHTITVDVA